MGFVVELCFLQQKFKPPNPSDEYSSTFPTDTEQRSQNGCGSVFWKILTPSIPLSKSAKNRRFWRATVIKVKGRLIGSDFWVPRFALLDHGIENRQKFTHTGGDGYFKRFASFGKAFIKRSNDRIKTDG